MFADFYSGQFTMAFSKEHQAQYEPLTESPIENDEPSSSATWNDSSSSACSSFPSKFTILGHISIITFELILAGIVLAGFMYHSKSCGIQKVGGSLDGLLDLGGYNTTMTFRNNSHLLRDTWEAKKYWNDALETAGVLSLDTQWAFDQGLRPSAVSPTDPSQSIYQVDVFHALHCLVSRELW